MSGSGTDSTSSPAGAVSYLDAMSSDKNASSPGTRLLKTKHRDKHRMDKNRQSAQRSRLRTKERYTVLEQENEQLRRENAYMFGAASKEVKTGVANMRETVKMRDIFQGQDNTPQKFMRRRLEDEWPSNGKKLKMASVLALQKAADRIEKRDERKMDADMQSLDKAPIDDDTLYRHLYCSETMPPMFAVNGLFGSDSADAGVMHVCVFGVFGTIE